MKIITDGWRRIFCVICWMASGRRIPYYLLDIFGLFQWKSNHSQHLVTKLSDINSSEWDLNLIQILSLVSIHLSTHKHKLISNIRSYIFFLSRYFKTQHVSLAQFLGDEIEVILIKFAVIVCVCAESDRKLWAPHTKNHTQKSIGADIEFSMLTLCPMTLHRTNTTQLITTLFKSDGYMSPATYGQRVEYWVFVLSYKRMQNVDRHTECFIHMMWRVLFHQLYFIEYWTDFMWAELKTVTYHHFGTSRSSLYLLMENLSILQVLWNITRLKPSCCKCTKISLGNRPLYHMFSGWSWTFSCFWIYSICTCR